MVGYLNVSLGQSESGHLPPLAASAPTVRGEAHAEVLLPERKWLSKESETPEVAFSPAGTGKDLSDGLRPEGVVEVVIDKEHPASVRVLIDMVGAAGFSAPEALVFDGPDPFPGGAVAYGGKLHTKSNPMTLVHWNRTRPSLTCLRDYPTVPISCGPI